MRISDWSADVCSSDLESNTTRRMFDRAVPASSMKGHLGHTLGACGAIESWWTLEMLNRGWFAPPLNLKTPDPRCGELDYVTGNGRDIQTEHVLRNHFAFRRITTPLTFRRTMYPHTPQPGLPDPRATPP